MEKIQVVDHSGPYLELKRLVDEIWQTLLRNEFQQARDLCDHAVAEARLLKAQIEVDRERSGQS
jgi:hypothetical protein